MVDRVGEAPVAGGDPGAIHFPRPLSHDGTFNFSFSGLKTAVLTHFRKHPETGEGQPLNDLCASFQAAVVEVLVEKTARAAERLGVTQQAIHDSLRRLRRTLKERLMQALGEEV